MSSGGGSGWDFSTAYQHGATRYVLARRAHGDNDATIARGLRDRYAGLPQRAATDLIARATRAGGRAGAAGQQGGAHTPGTAEFGRPDPGCLRYVYHVQVAYSLDGGAVQAPIISVSSATRISMAQAVADAEQVISNAAAGGNPADRKYGSQATTVQPLGSTVVGMERNC